MTDRTDGAVLKVAIIGGGLTGAVLALRLAGLRADLGSAAQFDITVFEPRAELGRGLAYDSRDPAHRINVPADKMSLYPEDDGIFARWFVETGELERDAQALAGDGRLYPRRETFGRFVHQLLKPLLASDRISHIRQRVDKVRYEAGRYVLQTGQGSLFPADFLVIATSHPAPRAPAQLDLLKGDPRFIPDATVPKALAGIAPSDRVLVIGSGLTSADVIASLDRQRHRGPITVFSRRGLRSRPHSLVPLEPFGDFLEPPVRSARALLRRVRAEIAHATTAGIGWQAVIDAVRSQGRAIWQALPVEERRRLVRHLRPYWDVHRFRLAPQLTEVLEKRVADGSLRYLAASLAGVNYDGPSSPIGVALKTRGEGPLQEHLFDAVVVTTGPAHGGIIASQPFLTALNDLGLVHMDETGLGLACDLGSHALDLRGRPVPGLYVAGPLARGTFGELMGLPQVTAHAIDVATALLEAISNRQTQIQRRPSLARAQS